jgi:hypothetical protein
MLKSFVLSSAVVGAALFLAGSADATPIQVYGTWHCGSDFCNWGVVRDMTEFDQKTTGSSTEATDVPPSTSSRWPWSIP